jgi:hypothetical protein
MSRVLGALAAALVALALLPAVTAAKPPKLSVGDAAAQEGDVLTFRVSLSKKAKKTVKARYATRDGSAGPSDYDAASGTVKIKKRKRVAKVEVRTREDAADEKDETIVLALTKPKRAKLGRAKATGTIRDDDEPAPPVGDPQRTTLYDINSGTFSPDSLLAVSGVHVTAVSGWYFWVQYESGDPDYDGVFGSGLEVDGSALPSIPPPGTVLSSLVGSPGSTGPAFEATAATAGGTAAIPAPLISSVDDIATNPGLDGVLVRIDDLTLIDGTPPWHVHDNGDPSDTTAQVTNRIFRELPLKPDGIGIASITGIADTGNSEDAILPRSAADILYAPPALVQLSFAGYPPPCAGTTVNAPIGRVTLDQPAVGDTDVQVLSNSSDLTIANNSVTIPDGQVSGDIIATANGPMSGITTVTVDADLGVNHLGGEVQVYSFSACPR